VKIRKANYIVSTNDANKNNGMLIQFEKEKKERERSM